VKIRWTATALNHLAEVPAIIGEDILQRVEMAAQYPLMYPERHRGRYRGYRWFPVSSWLVFYQVVGEEIIIRGILHGARRGV
jgi:plasmid stabilization system protein ParE